MSANPIGFPEIGVFLIVSKDNQSFYLISKDGKQTLPFEVMRGGSSWDETLCTLKKRSGVINSAHRLVGLGALKAHGEKGLVYSVFHVNGEPKELKNFSQIKWGLKPLVSIDPLSVDIISKYLARPEGFSCD